MSNYAIETLEPRRMLAFPIDAGGGGFDYGNVVAQAPDGSGVVVAGIFSGTVAFDSSTQLVSSGVSDVFIAKYDPNGALLWARRFGGAEGEFEIETRPNRPVDVAINPRRIGGEVFVNRVGPQPRDAGEYANGIDIAGSGEIYITGAFRGAASFGASAQTLVASHDRDFYDAYVLKLSPDGQLIWIKTFGGRFTDVGNDLAVDSSGDVYVTGLFTRDVDFDPSRGVLNVSARGRADAFVTKLSPNGRLVWVSAFGGEETGRDQVDSGNAITLLFDQPFVTGTFAGRADFDPRPGQQRLITAVGETDAFIVALNSAGQLNWVQTMGGEGFDGGTAIATIGIDGGLQLVTASYFEDEITVRVAGNDGILRAARERPGRRAANTDILLMQFHSSGALNWAKPISGGGYEVVSGLSGDNAGNVYVAGGFYGAVDFDPSRDVVSLRSTLFVGGREQRDLNESDRDRRDSYDAFFASYNRTGQLRFARSFGGVGDDFAMGIARDTVPTGPGAFVLTGRFAGGVDFDPSISSSVLIGAGRSDIFVTVFNELGELQSVVAV